MIAHEELLSRFRYSPDTGLFERKLKLSDRWVRCSATPIKSGKGAGYVSIKINNREYLAHRLAWFYTHGKWPEGRMDHINQVKHDNRIANLREATPQQNAVNSGLPTHNKTGFKGVSWHQASKKWRADMSLLGRNIYLGTYETPELASAAYDKYAAAVHGEFFYKGAQQ